MPTPLARSTIAHHLINGIGNAASSMGGFVQCALVLRQTLDGPTFYYDPHGLLRDPGHLETVRRHAEGEREEADRYCRAHLEAQERSSHPRMNLTELGRTVTHGLHLSSQASASANYILWVFHLPREYVGPSSFILAQVLDLASWTIRAELHSNEDIGALGTFRASHSLEMSVLPSVGLAAADVLASRIGPDRDFNAVAVFNALASISQTAEEGAFPTGSLCFFDRETIDQLEFASRFAPEVRPSLVARKHISKLLGAVSSSPSHSIAADSLCVHGVIAESEVVSPIRADFHHGRIRLRVNGQPWGRILSGKFRLPVNRGAALRNTDAVATRVSEATLGCIGALLERAEEGGHGCTFVSRGDWTHGSPSAHWLDPPIADWTARTEPSTLELVTGMSTVDGAVLIDRRERLVAFGAILDGQNVGSEDLSQGARFNSALRFSSAHPDAVVFVQSQDGPLTVFVGGEPVIQPRDRQLQISRTPPDEQTLLPAW